MISFVSSMETGKGSKRATPFSLKRKPLLDTTNLIPATTSRKLLSTPSEKTQFLSPIHEEFSESSSNITSQPSNGGPTSIAHCNSSSSNTSIRPCNFTATSRTHLPMLTGKGTVEKTNNKAGGGVNANDATDFFIPSPVSRTWDLKKGGKDKGKAKIALDICLNLERSNGHKSKNAEIHDLKTADVPLPENLNTKRKDMPLSRSNKLRGNDNTFDCTRLVKSKCRKLMEEKDLFIEQQISYFKEVDEFELMVEEASTGDSD